MTYENMLGIIGGVIGIVMFLFSIKDRGKDNGEQLARIEVNGLNIKNMVEDLKGELDKVKKDQAVSKTFRDKYEDIIKETAKLSKENEKAVLEIQRSIESMEEHLNKLDKKFDRMMEVFNAQISKQ